MVPVLGCAPQRQSEFLESNQTQTPPIITGQLVTLPGNEQENQKKIEELKAWANQVGAEVRVVDEALGVAEVFGASQDEIRDALPEAAVQHNLYFPNLIQDRESTAEIFDESPTSGIQCRERDGSLKINAGLVAGMAGRFDRGVTRLGSGPVSFAANESNGVAVTILWLVRGPRDSAFAQHQTRGSSVTITPDLPGSYDVLVLFARGDGRCLSRLLKFGVTTSEAFAGRKAARGFNPADKQLFKHLEVVQAEEAWTVTKGRGVKVAVIDTGVNFNHPDLSQNIDVDNTQKVVGYNFWARSENPFDDHGHGTHVAGLAASAVMGVAPEATILPIKAMNAMGGGDLAALVAAVRFAGRNGAQVINGSFGGDAEAFRLLSEPIQEATDLGSLFVVAAGNGDERGIGYDIDVRPTYPASLSMPGLLTVAATRLDGALSSYSNFGIRSVHVAAPGGDPSRDQGPLLSANYLPNKRLYAGEMGTSMATPVTAGVAALVKAVHPQWTPEQMKKHLLDSGTPMAALQGKLESGRLLNARIAVGR